MNQFTKQWLTSTLAPDSIRPVLVSDKGYYLDVVQNETGTIKVSVLSTDNAVLCVSSGKSLKEILAEQSVMPIMEGVHKCAELLGLSGYILVPKTDLSSSSTE